LGSATSSSSLDVNLLLLTFYAREDSIPPAVCRFTPAIGAGPAVAGLNRQTASGAGSRPCTKVALPNKEPPPKKIDAALDNFLATWYITRRLV
jgi:hypothetical protein